MEVKCFKLANGMDIIGRDLEFVNGNTVSLNNAVAINVSNKQGGGGPQLGFLPLTFFAADIKKGLHIQIDKSHILFHYEPSEEITVGYEEFVTSIAQVAKPKIIGV
jgi:hypothetical protein